MKAYRPFATPWGTLRAVPQSTSIPHQQTPPSQPQPDADESPNQSASGAIEATDSSAAYLIAQAGHIHERVQWYLERHERIEILGLAGSGAIWAFVLTQANIDAVPYLKWIPAIMSLVLAIKSYLLTKSLSEAFNHLSELEDYFKLPPQKGWVHYFTERSARYKRRWRTWFWIGLVTVNILAASLVPFSEIVSPSQSGVEQTSSQSSTAQAPPNKVPDRKPE